MNHKPLYLIEDWQLLMVKQMSANSLANSVLMCGDESNLFLLGSVFDLWNTAEVERAVELLATLTKKLGGTQRLNEEATRLEADLIAKKHQGGELVESFIQFLNENGLKVQSSLAGNH